MIDTLKHKGRLAQTRIYLGKFLRMFVYQNDWKALPTGAVIAAIVTFVVGTNLFITQEGTINGAFALTCGCIWNGFFNSIQVICRERDVVKREHRAGLHMSSYVAAHMIYQFILCAAQTAITLVICRLANIRFPEQGVVTPWSMLDIAITLQLITFAADMMALMISAIVRTTTTAMTTMPFMLIFQLVFSGAFFNLTGIAQKVTNLTVSKWGMTSICAIGHYNEQPMVTLWNTIFKLRDVEINGMKPADMVVQTVYENNQMDAFLQWSGQNNQNPVYASTVQNVLTNWGVLLLIACVAALISVLVLELIDRDKR